MSSFTSRGAWLATACALVAVLALIAPSRADSEAASSVPRPVQAGYLDAGIQHSCAILADRTLRCWGKGLAGRLGYGSDANILSAAAAPPVDLGGGRTARAMAAGDFHTCAILDDRSVKCWGFGANGRLGLGHTANVSLPLRGAAGRPRARPGRGRDHRRRIAHVRHPRHRGRSLLGQRRPGTPRLRHTLSVGDDETPGAVAPVNLGGRAARASPPATSTPARSSTTARCGAGASAPAASSARGPPPTSATTSRRPRASSCCPPGRAARAVAGGAGHTCAVLDDGTVSCWGFGANGRLGYGNATQRTTPGGPVALGAGRTAAPSPPATPTPAPSWTTARSAAGASVARGGWATPGDDAVGDDETPAAAGPVDVGAGRTARDGGRRADAGRGPQPAAPDEGTGYTCALLDDGTLRCWGYGVDGRLGYGDEQQVAGPGFPSPAAKGRCPRGDGRLPGRRLGGPRRERLRGRPRRRRRPERDGEERGPRPVGVALSVPPAGLAYTAAAPTQGGFDGASGRWEVGALAPGASAWRSCRHGRLPRARTRSRRRWRRPASRTARTRTTARRSSSRCPGRRSARR